MKYFQIIIKRVLTIAFLNVVLFSLMQPVLADDDYIEARRLQDAGEILSLQVILGNIKSEYPGKVLEVELEKEEGDIVYEVEILGADGIVRELYINAKTGKILSVKEDD
ncbi:MAG TPA: hypothetical protein ENJ08_14385 [Gammaproteobacteria bacterium]|nr:hypothetical protein [Gammaproteobacteria bacterium]